MLVPPVVLAPQRRQSQRLARTLTCRSTCRATGLLFGFLLGLLLLLRPAAAATTFINGTVGPLANPGVAAHYPSTVHVAGLSGAVIKVTVTLHNVSHTFPDDIDLLLVGPGGQSAVLMSDAGGTFDLSGVDLTFDDAAVATLPDASQIVGGTYKPTNVGTGDTFSAPAPAGPYGSALSFFNGTAPNGNWSLYVVDDLGGDLGRLGDWSLSIATNGAFTSSGNIAIPNSGAATPYPSFYNISGFDGTLTHVAVRLNGLSHTNPDDIDVLLVGPEGQTVLLMSDAGGTSNVNGVNLTFDDAAAAPLPNDTQITSGVYQPSNYLGSGADSDAFPAPAPGGLYGSALSVFNGTNPNGTWRLYVVDDTNFDVGSIAGGWSLLLDGQFSSRTVVINDGTSATPYPSTVEVFNVPGRVTKATVTLHDLRHVLPDDMDVLLVGPTGQKALLMSDAGGGGNPQGVTLTFNDAAASLPDAGPIASGTYKPSDYGGVADSFASPAPAGPYGTALSAFNGTDPNGIWSLYVMDDSGGYRGPLAGGWSLTLEAPPPVASVGDVSLTEGDAGLTNATFTVSLSQPAVLASSVGWYNSDGTAQQPFDYSPAGGTVTFAPGEAAKSFTVPVVGDPRDEANETFKVNLNAPVNVTIGDGLGVGTILDNDPTPFFTINDVTLTEGNAGTINADFHIDLSAASGRTVTVTYKTADGTATAGSDYVAHPSTTLTFTPGQTSKTIIVQIKGDAIDEALETFKVLLTSATFAAIVDDKGVGTITDDDPLPQLSISDAPAKAEGNAGPHNALFTVTLAGATGRTVTVNYATANGTATAGSDYTAAAGTLTFLPGQTSKTLPIQVLGDTVVEPNETLKVNLSGASFATISDSQGVHTINNDDGSE